jgi:hypothetical protein
MNYRCQADSMRDYSKNRPLWSKGLVSLSTNVAGDCYDFQRAANILKDLRHTDDGLQVKDDQCGLIVAMLRWSDGQTDRRFNKMGLCDYSYVLYRHITDKSSHIKRQKHKNIAHF